MCWCGVEKCTVYLLCGTTKGICVVIGCPKLQGCYCCIPHWIFPSHGPVICGIYVAWNLVGVELRKCRFKMITVLRFLEIYILISESIIVKYLRWFLMIQCCQDMCPLMGVMHAICVVCFKSNGHCSTMKLSIVYRCSNMSLIIKL